jgi:hypothetical protein
MFSRDSGVINSNDKYLSSSGKYGQWTASALYNAITGRTSANVRIVQFKLNIVRSGLTGADSDDDNGYANNDDGFMVMFKLFNTNPVSFIYPPIGEVHDTNTQSELTSVFVNSWHKAPKLWQIPTNNTLNYIGTDKDVPSAMFVPASIMSPADYNYKTTYSGYNDPATYTFSYDIFCTSYLGGEYAVAGQFAQATSSRSEWIISYMSDIRFSDE